MTTIVEHDTINWVLNRTHYCDVPCCSQPASIIAASSHNDRFCCDHADHASAVTTDATFTGWYRITATHYCAHVLVAAVYAI